MVARITLCGMVVLAGACAEAGRPGSGQADASGKQDGSPGVDAPRFDAAPSDGGSPLCASAATCPTATSLGSVSGDTGASQVTASGFQAAWYVVRVTEDDSGPFGTPMLLLTQLTSPASAAYDLFVYVNTGSDVLDCTTPTGSATVNGTQQSLDLRWGETGTFANGVDDGRSVSIEIRPKPGASCAAANPWQLVVIGDT